MEDYNFWADLLESYRASPDFAKALWLLVPLCLALGVMALAVAAALRLTEPRGQSATEEEDRSAITMEGSVLIEMQPEEKPVSPRLPFR